MKAKEYAKVILELSDPLLIHKTFIKKCLEKQSDILNTRYKGKINKENYISAFKDVDTWQKSVVHNLLKIDTENKFKDFSSVWKDITNQSLEEQGFTFRM